MKWFLLILFLIMTSCTTAPVKKGEEVVPPPKKTSVKPAKPFLKHVKKEDKEAFDEIKDNKKILHLQSTEMSKAMQKIDFWAALDPVEFNNEFTSNMYTKEGNDYIYKICSTANQDKTILLDFLNYDSVVDDKDRIYEMDSSKERYQPLITKNVEGTLFYCREFKEILCDQPVEKGVRKITKAKLMKTIQNPQVDNKTKEDSLHLWYELKFCESVKSLK